MATGCNNDPARPSNSPQSGESLALAISGVESESRNGRAVIIANDDDDDDVDVDLI